MWNFAGAHFNCLTGERPAAAKATYGNGGLRVPAIACYFNDRPAQLLPGEYDCNVVLNKIPPYIQLMSMVRLAAILFVAALAAGQQNDSATSSNIPEPKLPVIDYDACPGKNIPIPDVKLVKGGLIYSSPNKGKLVARLSAGEKVTVLAGANVVRQPDRAVIKYVSPDQTSWPPLKVGDVVLSYGWHVDGNMVFWAKGVGFKKTLRPLRKRAHAVLPQASAPVAAPLTSSRTA